MTEKILQEIAGVLRVPKNTREQFCSDLSRLVDQVRFDISTTEEFRWIRDHNRELTRKLEAFRKAAGSLTQAAADPAVREWLGDWHPGLLKSASEIEAYMHHLRRKQRALGPFRRPPLTAKKPKGPTRPDFQHFVCWTCEAARRAGGVVTITADIDEEAKGTLARGLSKLRPLLPPGFLPAKLKASTLRRASKLSVAYPLDPVPLPPDP